MAKCKAFTGSAVKWLKYHLAVHTSRVLPVFSVPAVRCSVFFSLAISVALRRSFVSRDVTVLQTYPDLFCLSETSWIKHTTTSTELAHCKPPNYCLLCTARPLNRNRLTLQVLAFLFAKLLRGYYRRNITSPPSNHHLSLSNYSVLKYQNSMSVATFIFIICLASPLELTSCFTSWTSFTFPCLPQFIFLFSTFSIHHSFTVSF